LMVFGTGPGPARQDGRTVRPVLWVICGAGRGVGKTRLALDLCRVLPDAAYAKQGTSRQREGKPASYFHGDDELDAFLAAEARAGRRHLVVESNALVRRGSGDIVVFLDAPAGESPRGELRADAGELRAKAHIRVGWSPAETAQGVGAEAADDGPGAASEATRMDDLREHLVRLGLDAAVIPAVIRVFRAQDAWKRGRVRS
jgi:hypothetical protein